MLNKSDVVNNKNNNDNSSYSLLIFSYSSLRLNTKALHKAMEMAVANNQNIISIFIEDKELSLIEANSNSERFLYSTLHHLNKDFQDNFNTEITLLQGDFKIILNNLLLKYHIKDVFASVVYEPKFLSLYKDLIASYLEIDFHFFNDSLLHTSKDVLNKSNEPYQVFTPFYNNLIGLLKLNFKPLPVELSDKLSKHPCLNVYNLMKLKGVDFIGAELVLNKCADSFNAGTFNVLDLKSCVDFSLKTRYSDALTILDEFLLAKINNYNTNRDIPALIGTSNLAVYLRFGIISISYVFKKAMELSINNNLGAEIFIKELIWREFAYYVSYYFPNILYKNHKPLYNNFIWQNNKDDFTKFSQGLTGYPIVDAGVRQLITTGNMHNRVRMIVASFLIKNLAYPWQLGAGFFAKYLFDYDPIINSFSWQWVAGCGFDASPYFRVFNPKLQNEKFDLQCVYIKQYVKELQPYSNKEILAIYEQDTAKDSLLHQANNYVSKIVDFKASRDNFLAKAGVKS